MKQIPLILAILSVTMLLSGCTSAKEDGKSDGETIVDKDTLTLTTQGALAGLLLDDRYRPIDLEETGGAGEFQSLGFILIQETGQRIRTNENGEFQVLNLDPGSYTIRLQSEGHEMTPIKTQIVAGEFSEITLTARRISTASNTIITEEYTVFIPCAFVVPGYGLFTLNCVLDLSGDSFRSSVQVSWHEVYPGDLVKFMVIEALMNQESNYVLVVRDSGSACPCYARDNYEGNYGRVQFERGVANEGQTAWENTKSTNVGTFFSGDIDLVAAKGGAKAGIEGRYLVSLFLTPPEVDLDTYCVYCG